MIIYGWNPVREALRAHPTKIRYVGVAQHQRAKMQSLVAEAKEAGVSVKFLAPNQIDKLAAGKVHNGVIAEVSHTSYADFDDIIGSDDTQFVLLLDGIQDPQNLGAILRVADGFGVDLVVLPLHESVGLTAAVAKASAGASEWIAVAQVTNLSRAIEALKERGFWVYAADGDGESLAAFDLRGKVAIVMGSEGSGVRRNVREHCDRIMAIPTQGRLESLNVATACAIIAYEVARQNG